MSKPVEYKVDDEYWSSTYTIESGKWKGYRIKAKIVMSRIILKDKVDDDGMPVFRLAHTLVTTVLPPITGA